MRDPREPDHYRPPSRSSARTNLVAGLFVGAGCLFAAWVMNDVFSAVERGEDVDVPVPAPLVDLYEAVGRQWTVAMFAVLGLALLTYGIFAWWRERASD